MSESMSMSRSRVAVAAVARADVHFVLSRMVPRSLLDDPDEPLSAIRDELPYMDTDIARGLVQ